MEQQVSVVLKSGERFDFPLAADQLAGIDPVAARHWIGEEFVKAGLEPPNPMGKMLLVDQILLLAANFKPADYHPATPAVGMFLRRRISGTRQRRGFVLQSVRTVSISCDCFGWKMKGINNWAANPVKTVNPSSPEFAAHCFRGSV